MDNPYNLLENPWLPVLLDDGSRVTIAPWDITRTFEDNYVKSLNFPRPDFNGAGYNFLIGLIQLALPPSNPREHRLYVQNPPSPERLRDALQPFYSAFNLNGDGARFMQDLELVVAQPQTDTPVSSLLIDSPGANTIRQNLDLFIKRGRVEFLCCPCAAIALFTLQCFAPAGGQGHRTSLRGGGPLTTIIWGETLWQTVWNNILQTKSMPTVNDSSDLAGKVFPWLAPTKTSEGGTGVFLQDVHPLHHYWGMPRRIRLVFDNNQQSRECDICGEQTSQGVSRYVTKNLGYNYQGTWQHPLTPYRDTGQLKLPIKGSFDSLAYKNWLGLLYAMPVATESLWDPAEVVKAYQRRTPPGGQSAADFHVYAFGYKLDNMKAIAWCEGTIPGWIIDDRIREHFLSLGIRLVNYAQLVRDSFLQALKRALFHEKHEVKMDKSFFRNAEYRFWEESKQNFFQCMLKGKEQLENGQDDTPIRKEWQQLLSTHAERLFSSLILNSAITGLDIERVIRALADLQSFTGLYDKKVQHALDLEVPKKKE